MANRDLRVGIVLILFGIVGGTMALQHDLKAEYGPGPGFFPFILFLTLIVLAVVMIISARRTHGNKPLSKSSLMFRKPKVVISCLGVFLIVALLFEKVGFLIIIALTIAAYVKLIKPDHPWTKSLLIGVVSSVVIYSLFTGLLGINLPKGVLPL